MGSSGGLVLRPFSPASDAPTPSLRNLPWRSTHQRPKGGWEQKGRARCGPHPGCRRGVLCSSRDSSQTAGGTPAAFWREEGARSPARLGPGAQRLPCGLQGRVAADPTHRAGADGVSRPAPPHQARGVADAETWVLPAPTFEQSLPHALSCRKKGNSAAAPPPPHAGDGLRSHRSSGPRGPLPESESRAAARSAGPARTSATRPQFGAARALTAALPRRHRPRAPRSGRSPGRGRRRSAQAPRRHFPKARGRDFLESGAPRPALRARAPPAGRTSLGCGSVAPGGEARRHLPSWSPALVSGALPAFPSRRSFSVGHQSRSHALLDLLEQQEASGKDWPVGLPACLTFRLLEPPL